MTNFEFNITGNLIYTNIKTPPIFVQFVFQFPCHYYWWVRSETWFFGEYIKVGMAKIWQKMKKSLSFTPKKNFGYPPTTSRPLPIHHLVYTFNDFKANFVLVGTYLPICAKDRVDLGSSKIWTKKNLKILLFYLCNLEEM